MKVHALAVAAVPGGAATARVVHDIFQARVAHGEKPAARGVAVCLPEEALPAARLGYDHDDIAPLDPVAGLATLGWTVSRGPTEGGSYGRSKAPEALHRRAQEADRVALQRGEAAERDHVRVRSREHDAAKVNQGPTASRRARCAAAIWGSTSGSRRSWTPSGTRAETTNA